MAKSRMDHASFSSNCFIPPQLVSSTHKCPFRGDVVPMASFVTSSSPASSNSPPAFPVHPISTTGTASSSLSDTRTLLGSRRNQTRRGSHPVAGHALDGSVQMYPSHIGEQHGDGAQTSRQAPLFREPFRPLATHAPSDSRKSSVPFRPRFVIDLELDDEVGGPTPRNHLCYDTSHARTPPRTRLSQRLRRAIINDDLVTARRLAAHASELAQRVGSYDIPSNSAAARAWQSQRATLLEEDFIAPSRGDTPSTPQFSIRNIGSSGASAMLVSPSFSPRSDMAAHKSADQPSGPFHLSPPTTHHRDPTSSAAILPSNNNASHAINCPKPPFPRESIDAELDSTKSSLQLALEYGCGIEMIDWLLEMGHEQHNGSLNITRDHLGRSMAHLAAIYNRPDIMALYCSHVHFLLTVPKIAAAAAQEAERAASDDYKSTTSASSRPVSPFGTHVDSESQVEGNSSKDQRQRPAPVPLPQRESSPTPSQGVKGVESPDGQKQIEDILDSFDSNAGRTALHDAALRGHEECVRLLLELGASIDSADLSGNTPLHYASSYGHLTSVQLLIEKGGAQFTLRNDGGFSAADYAFTMGDRAALEAFGRKWITDQKDKRKKKKAQEATLQQRRRAGVSIEDELENEKREHLLSGGHDDGASGNNDDLEDLRDDSDDARAHSDDDDESSSSPTRGFSFNASRKQSVVYDYGPSPTVGGRSALPLPPTTSHHQGRLRSRTPDFFHVRHTNSDSSSGGPSSAGPGSLFRGASVRRAAAAAAQHVAHTHNHLSGQGASHSHGLRHHFSSVRDRAHQYGLSHRQGHHGSPSGASVSDAPVKSITSGESLRDRFNIHRKAEKGAAAADSSPKSFILSPLPSPLPSLAVQKKPPAHTPPASSSRTQTGTPLIISTTSPPPPGMGRSRANSSGSSRYSARSSSIGSTSSESRILRGNGAAQLPHIAGGSTIDDAAAAPLASSLSPNPSLAGGEPNRADVAPWELVDPERSPSINTAMSTAPPLNLTSPGKVIRKQGLEQTHQQQQASEPHAKGAPAENANSETSSSSPSAFRMMNLPHVILPSAIGSANGGSNAHLSTPLTRLASSVSPNASSSDTALHTTAATGTTAANNASSTTTVRPNNKATSQPSKTPSSSSGLAPSTRGRSETDPVVFQSTASRQTDSSGSGDTIIPSPSQEQIRRAQADRELSARVESVLGGVTTRHGKRRGSSVGGDTGGSSK